MTQSSDHLSPWYVAPSGYSHEMRIARSRSSKQLGQISLFCFALLITGAGSNATAETIVMPVASVNPGAIISAVTPTNISKTICKSGWTATIRPSSASTDKIIKSNGETACQTSRHSCGPRSGLKAQRPTTQKEMRTDSAIMCMA
jgi:hypothetical protein